MLLNILLTLLIVVGVALTGLVLLQRSEGGALGMGGGGGQLVSARGAANFLTRTTWWLGGAFFVLSLLITIILGNQSGTGSITDQVKIEALDPAKMAADQKAAFEAAKAKADAEKAKQTGGALPGGFSAPAPSVGVAPFSAPAPAPVPAPFVAPAPKASAPAPKAAAPKQAAPAAPAPAATDLPILPTPNP